jgi:hypothetical protein
MQIIERHGGGSHFVRPDRVYRTGVLTSSMGFDPGADVQSVAASFTQYPMDLQPTGLSGLGRLQLLGLAGLGANVGLIDKLRLRFSAWRAKRRAQSFMMGPASPAQAAVFEAMGRGGAIEPQWGAAYPQVGEEIAPQMIAKEQMVAHLIRGGGLPAAFATAQEATSYRKWTSNWWNT